MNTPRPISVEATTVAREHWLTERDTARMVGISTSKLRQDRHKCKGIPYVKLGRSVRYALADIQSYMASRRIDPASI
jgi:hypothetical protein